MDRILPVRAHVVLAILWTCILLLNVIFLKSALLGALGVFLYVVSASVVVRRRMVPDARSFVGIILGAVGALALFIVMSVGVYWIIGWDVRGVFGVMAALPIIVRALPARAREMASEDDTIRLTMSASPRVMHGILVFALQMALLGMLYGARVDHAIISPWEAVPSLFMPLFALTTLFLIGYYTRRDASAGVFLAGLHGIIMAGVALLVFELGYGFDPFIHRAAALHIFAHGELLPKTPYYIGQYTPLVALGHLIGPAAIVFFERLLVPTLAPIALVVATNYAMTRAGARRFVPLVALASFAVPFSTFIVTTPQGLANLFLAVMMVLMISFVKRGVSLVYVWLLALAAVAVHPLSGVPALVGALLITVLSLRLDTRAAALVRGGVLFAVLVASSAILPLLLLAGSGGVGRVFEVLSHVGIPRFVWQIGFMRALDPTLDILYAYRFLLMPLMVWLFAYGLWLFARSREARRVSFVFCGLALVLLINATLMASGVPLSLVIDYEQQNYALRVMDMVALALVPMFAILIYHFFDRIERATWIVRAVGIAVFVVALSASMYFSYPMNNPVERARGYSVARVDGETVDAIERHAAGVPYVVLANQQVSAAAIARLGFVRYFPTIDGEQFLYSIPTGSRLYEYYLTMVYGEPGAAVAREVMDYMGVDRVYLVVSPYWWNADAVARAALSSARESFQLDFANRVFVFVR